MFHHITDSFENFKVKCFKDVFTLQKNLQKGFCLPETNLLKQYWLKHKDDKKKEDET